MSAMNEDLLTQLRQAKLTGLVRAGFGVALPEGASGRTGSFRSGATLLDGPRAFVLIDDAQTTSLGGALVWFARQDASELHVLVDGEPGVAEVLARQAACFAAPPQIWRVRDRALESVEAANPPALPAPLPTGSGELLEMLDAAGVDIVVEHGIVKGEVLGLEVARIVASPGDASSDPGDDRGCTLEVGVGRFDREVGAMMHADLPGEENLANAVELVRRHRHVGAERHPLRDLVPERWVRSMVLADPSLVGAATLAPCDTTIEPPNLRARQPAAAIGIDDSGRSVIVVCSAGVDVDLVPLAADTRAWLDPDALLVLAVAVKGLPSVICDVAAMLDRPADVVELAPLF